MSFRKFILKLEGKEEEDVRQSFDSSSSRIGQEFCESCIGLYLRRYDYSGPHLEERLGRHTLLWYARLFGIWADRGESFSYTMGMYGSSSGLSLAEWDRIARAVYDEYQRRYPQGQQQEAVSSSTEPTDAEPVWASPGVVRWVGSVNRSESGTFAVGSTPSETQQRSEPTGATRARAFESYINYYIPYSRARMVRPSSYPEERGVSGVHDERSSGERESEDPFE